MIGLAARVAIGRSPGGDGGLLRIRRVATDRPSTLLREARSDALLELAIPHLQLGTHRREYPELSSGPSDISTQAPSTGHCVLRLCEIIAVMRTIGDRPGGHRLRALIVLFYRPGPRPQQIKWTELGR